MNASLLRTACAALALTTSAGAALQDDESPHWPGFRGDRARGVSEGYATLESFDVPSADGVLWRTAVPGLAHSSPVVWGEIVFVTTAVRSEGDAELSSLYGSPGYGAGESVEDEGPHSFEVHAYDRASGELLWSRVAHEGVPAVKRHPKSSHAASTPACDAERVIAFFGSEGLYAYDHDGELLWSKDFGVLDAGAPVGADNTDDYQWGFASSPVLVGDDVFVQCDVQDQSFVACLDAATGEERWRTNREEAPTWCTPTVSESGAGGRRQVILNGYHHIGGYDAATGEEIWKLVGGGDVPVPTPIVAHGLILITSSHGPMRPIYAIDVEAEGPLEMSPDTCEHMAWSHRNAGIYMQTPLVYGEELYACSDGGVLACYDVGTGDRHYRERLGTGQTGFSASAVAADGKLYFTGEDGSVTVVLPGPDFEVVSTNDLGETCMATPAISQGVLFFRTQNHLVAVGE